MLTRRRWEAQGGDRELVYDVALWGFPAGVIGGRLYFLATSWNQVPAHWWGPFAIWKGGLGIWAGSRSGRSSGSGACAAPARACPASWTRERPVCSSRRRSGGSATTSTRSSSADRRRCRGRCGWTPRTAPRDIRGHDLPADVPLRDDLQPRLRRLPDLARAHRPDQTPGPVRALRRRIQRVSHLGGDAADRPLALSLRPAHEPLRRGALDARGRASWFVAAAAPAGRPPRGRERRTAGAPTRAARSRTHSAEDLQPTQ